MKKLKTKVLSVLLVLAMVMGMELSPMALQDAYAAAVPVYIEVEHWPDKAVFEQGDTFTYTNLSVNIVYDDGTIESVMVEPRPDLFTVYGPADMTKIGEYDVAIVYTEYGVKLSTSYQVWIVEKSTSAAEKTLTNLYITTEPSNVYYYVGTQKSEISLSGMSALAYYSDGTSADVSSKCFVSSLSDTSSVGTATVTVGYTEGGVTLTDFYYIYTYTNDLVPTSDYYTGGNYYITDVTDASNNPYYMYATGLSYGDGSASALARASNIEKGMKMMYNGSSYLATDFVDIIFVKNTTDIGTADMGKAYQVTLTLDESVSKKYNLNVWRSNMSNSSVSIFKKSSSSSDGNYSISGSTIKLYTRYSGTFGISYTVESGKVKTVKFDNYPTNYNDYSVQYVDSGDYATDPGDPYKDNDEFLGWYNGSKKWDFYNNKVTSNITLSAKWKSGWTNGSTETAKTLDRIVFTTAPKNSFTVGDTFTCDGVLTAYYTDGSSSVLSSGSYSVSSPDMSTAGTKTVNVSYTYNSLTKSTSYNISVVAKETASTATTTVVTVTKPAKAVIDTVTTPKAKALKVFWDWDEDVDGYVIQVSTTKDFANFTKKTIKVEKNAYTFTNLNSGKKYYVRMRAFVKDANGSNVWGKWSTIKAKTVK